MRFSIPLIALCAVPAAVGFALPSRSNGLENGDKDSRSSDWDRDNNNGERHHEDHGDHRNHTDPQKHDNGVAKHHHKSHRHKHKHLHPHEHLHHHYHKHPEKPCHVLTEKTACKAFHELADQTEKVIHAAQTEDCGNNEQCWRKVIHYIYALEFSLDLFDKFIDRTTLRTCFNCDQESVIVDCYLTYADNLIRLLKVLKQQSKYLEGEIDRPLLTAINSLRNANYVLTYEFARRVNCKKTLKIIMEKQGADDGSTKGSVQQAFSKFIYTPLITGDDFKNKGSYGKPKSYGKESESEDEDEKKNKHIKYHKHHHEHHHGHKNGHKHHHGHHNGHKHGHSHHDDHKHHYDHKHENDRHDNVDSHYRHHEVRAFTDPQYFDKDNYSLEPSEDNYMRNPYGEYRNVEREKDTSRYLDGKEERLQEENKLEKLIIENLNAERDAEDRRYLGDKRRKLREEEERMETLEQGITRPKLTLIPKKQQDHESESFQSASP